MRQQQVCTKKDEWFTPVELIEKVKRCGLENPIDLASCDKAASLHGFSFYFTKESSFLTCSKHWKISNFWLNPPFSLCREFVDHLSECGYKKGVVLVNANTETKYFRKLAGMASYCVLLSKRISFLDSETLEPVKGNPKGQALFFIGDWRLSLIREIFPDDLVLIPFD